VDTYSPVVLLSFSKDSDGGFFLLHNEQDLLILGGEKGNEMSPFLCFRSQSGALTAVTSDFGIAALFLQQASRCIPQQASSTSGLSAFFCT